MLLLENLKFAKEENCISKYKLGELVLWKSNVDKLDKIVSNTDYNIEDLKFEQAMVEITNTIPSILGSDAATQVRYSVSKDFEGYEEYFNNNSIGKKFLTTAEKLKKLLDKRE